MKENVQMVGYAISIYSVNCWYFGDGLFYNMLYYIKLWYILAYYGKLI